MTTPSTTGDLAAIASNAPSECPYCGKPLKTTSLAVMGRTYAALPCFGSCGCARSRDALEGRATTEAERREARYRAAGIGSRYFGAKVENPEWYQAVKSGRGLFVTGAIGTGKTHLASAIAMRLIDAGRSVRFETMVGILRQLRNDFATHASDVLERCVGCDALVLDDLGKEKPTEWALSVLYEVVNVRYANGLPIVVTTNHSPSGLIGRLGEGNPVTAEAVVSRLYETSDKVVLDNEDRRTA